MVARAWAPAAILALVLGCGGESVRDASHGSDGGGGGSGGGVGGSATPSAGHGAAAEQEPRGPTKNGVPISDCTDPTPEEQTAAGCPIIQPYVDGGEACDLPNGTRCRYEIVTTSRSSYQPMATCDGHTWKAVFGEDCGVTCLPAGETRALDTADCLTREPSPCDTTSTGPLTAYEVSTRQLAELVEACDVSHTLGDKIELEFANGCPSALSTSDGIAASALECLVSALSVARWECAEPTRCVTWDLDIR